MWQTLEASQMTQQSLPLYQDMQTSTKYLVYAKMVMVREHYPDDDDDSFGFYRATKKEYKTEEVLVGVVDHEDDIALISKKENIDRPSRFDWKVDSIKYYARQVKHYSFE